MIGKELTILDDLEQRSARRPRQDAATPLFVRAAGLGRWRLHRARRPRRLRGRGRRARRPARLRAHRARPAAGRRRPCRRRRAAASTASRRGSATRARRCPATSRTPRRTAHGGHRRRTLGPRQHRARAAGRPRLVPPDPKRRQSTSSRDSYIKALNIRPANPDALVSNLSGGNQQKVLLARWLAIAPRLLILDEPTRGIDVGAKAEIQKLVADLADNGMSVVFISAELEEVAAAQPPDRRDARPRKLSPTSQRGRSPSTLLAIIADGSQEDHRRGRRRHRPRPLRAGPPGAPRHRPGDAR